MVVENGPSKFQQHWTQQEPPDLRIDQTEPVQVFQDSPMEEMASLAPYAPSAACRDMDCLPGNIEKAMEIHGFPWEMS